MLKYFRLRRWRRAIRAGDFVKIKVAKNKFLVLKVVLDPKGGEVDVFNPETINYETYKLKKVFPTVNI